MKKTFSTIAFILIFAVLFSCADRILSRKSTEGWWNVTEKIDGFYNSPENEYDVMFFGSSNAYCSFNPLVIWNKTGVKSYVFATQQQPVWATYHYIAEALKTQSPKLAVVDILMFSKNDEYYDDGVNYTFCDNMPLSKNKIELICASAPPEDRFNLACRFMKYHSRWNELTEADFTYRKSDMHDYSKGYYVLTKEYPDAVKSDTSAVFTSADLSRKNAEYLNKIIDLCKTRGVELMLVKTPSNSTAAETEYYNTVSNIAAENGIFYADYNQCYDKIGLELKKDFYDDTHLNIRGAEKFSEYFVDTVDFFSGKTRSDDSWLSDWEKYSDVKKIF